MNKPVTCFEKPGSIKSLAMIRARTVVGVTALPVMVEVHLANGLPSFSTVGLPETAVKESKDRVRGAIINSGFEFPAKRITVNLAPADLPKTGGRFDLPIAIGILLASGQLPNVSVDDLEMVGELALDGRLRKISGVLPTALACGQADRQLVIPFDNALEASLAEQTNSWHAEHLLNVCQHIAEGVGMSRCEVSDNVCSKSVSYLDLSDVKGQERAKRALEIAAAGGHSLLFIGPPGTGKSMLASRLPGVLPNLTLNQALEAAAVQSVAQGEFNVDHWLQRPFRSPHHSASSVALVGGGSYPRPGEISLAHNGILFLDELTEFSRHLPRISVSELRKRTNTIEASADVRQRVKKVRDCQVERQARLNCDLKGLALERHCKLNDDTHRFLDMACERLHLSARAYHRVLRLARTIADMSNKTEIEQSHIAEAISYRSLDRQNA